MTQQDLIAQVAQSTPSKIIFLVIDGLGGLPHPDTGKSELETAHTPNLDRLAARAMCGLTDPVAPGITPGSGPGHLALFGYDPVRSLIKRGVLEAAGIGLNLGPDDLAVRGNFCTVDKNGVITHRRAGRLPTEESRGLCRKLDRIQVPGAEIEVHPVESHRFVIIFKGRGLSDELADTDQQVTGVTPPPVKALTQDAVASAAMVNEFVEKARGVLGHQPKANMITLRGFSKLPDLAPMNQVYKLNPVALATYPMYRGLARLLGMKYLDTGPTFEDQVNDLVSNYDDYDFFFIHFKGADTAGEDGDFQAKVQALEEVDCPIGRLMELEPEVFVVAGDHSTPAILGNHSWHPVPFLMQCEWSRKDSVTEFTELACAGGVLGRFPAREVMPLALAHAGKLTKYGA